EEVAKRIDVGQSPTRCPYCHEGLDPESEEWRACASCLACHHVACWKELGRCGACACEEALERADAKKKKATTRRRSPEKVGAEKTAAKDAKKEPGGVETVSKKTRSKAGLARELLRPRTNPAVVLASLISFAVFFVVGVYSARGAIENFFRPKFVIT